MTIRFALSLAVEAPQLKMDDGACDRRNRVRIWAGTRRLYRLPYSPRSSKHTPWSLDRSAVPLIFPKDVIRLSGF